MKTCVVVAFVAFVESLAIEPLLADERQTDLQSSVPAVRAQAAAALGRKADRADVPALMSALADPAKEVRREAAKALGTLKDGRATAALIVALKDRDTNVRTYASYALGEIKDPAAFEPLLRAMADPEYTVRDQAAWALRELHDPRLATAVAPLLRQSEADVPHLVWLLRQASAKEAVRQLSQLLADRDTVVRLRAAKALAEMNDAAALPGMLAALDDADPGVRQLAVAVVLKHGGEAAQTPLTRLLTHETDPVVRELASQGLRRMTQIDGLAAHWSFDDGNAKVARDVTGHRNDGEIHGCQVVPGKVGMALRFGKGQYVELGKPPALNVTQRPVTIMAWVKPESPNGVVVARGGKACGYSLYVKEGGARFGIRRSQDTEASLAVAFDLLPAQSAI